MASVKTAYPPISMSGIQEPLPVETQPDPMAVQPNTPIRGEFDYLSRGGISNTVNAGMSQIKEMKRQKLMQRMYEEILARGEQGGQALYNDAVAVYGPEVRAWIPQVDGFRGEDGRFSGVKYSEHVYTGVQKYKEYLTEQQQKEAERQGFQAIAPVIQGAGSAREAAAGIAAQGVDPGKMGQVYDMFPGPIDPMETQLKQSQIAENEAQTQKTLREANTPKAQPADTALTAALSTSEKAKASVYQIDNQLRGIKNKKAEALKNKVLDTTSYDEDAARLEAELVAAKKRAKIADDTVTRLVEQGDTELRRAMAGSQRSVNISESEAGLDRLHGIYGTPPDVVDAARGNFEPIKQRLSSEITPPGQIGTPLPGDPSEAQSYVRSRAQQLTGSPRTADAVIRSISGGATTSPEGEGDPDVIQSLQGNPKLWRDYQAADPMKKARMRAMVRATIDGNPTTR